MLGSVVLDVAIGMVFVFLLLSLIASAIQELLATIVQARPANLYRGLLSLFSGSSINGITYVEEIYNHGLIQGLYRGASDYGFPIKPTWLGSLTGSLRRRVTSLFFGPHENAPRRLAWRSPLAWLMRVERLPNLPGVDDLRILPSYIPARTFALALVDLLNTNKATGSAATNVKNALLTASLDDPNNKAIQALLALSLDAGDDLQKLQTNIANWYNDAMDRVSGWYKKNTQYVLLGIGLLLAVGFNVNSVQVARTLWLDRDVRQSMVDAAGKMEEQAAKAPVASGSTAPAGTSYDTQTTPPVSGATPAPPSSATADPCTGNIIAADGKSRAAAADASSVKNSESTSGSKSAGAADPCYVKALQARMNANIAAFQTVSAPLLPVGWSNFPVQMQGSFTHRLGQLYDHLAQLLPVFLGWVVTAVAISFGAPFWFDTLNKFMVVRGTVKPQEKSQTEASKDPTNAPAGGSASSA